MNRKLTPEEKAYYEWYIEQCTLSTDINLLIRQLSEHQGDSDYRELLQKAEDKKSELCSLQSGKQIK